DFVLFRKLACEHQDLLAAHCVSSHVSIVGTRTWPGADWVSSEWRIGEIELVRILRRDQRRVQQEGTAHGRLASELAGGHVNCRLDHGRWVRCGDRRTLVALLYHLDDLLHAVA